MKINNDYILGISEKNKNSQGYFCFSGCDNCNNGLGNNVHDFKAFFTKDNIHDHYDIKLCWQCVCSYYNGESLEKECNNIYKI